jgi:hypothetical protein
MKEDELRNPANWAMEDATLHPPVKSPRSVVSVSFGSDDLAIVANAAREAGMKTSEFIRNAAVEQARSKRRRHLDVFSGGASQGVLTVLSTNWRRSGRARIVVRRPQGQ